MRPKQGRPEGGLPYSLEGALRGGLASDLITTGTSDIGTSLRHASGPRERPLVGVQRKSSAQGQIGAIAE